MNPPAQKEARGDSKEVNLDGPATNGSSNLQ